MRELRLVLALKVSPSNKSIVYASYKRSRLAPLIFELFIGRVITSFLFSLKPSYGHLATSRALV